MQETQCHVMGEARLGKLQGQSLGVGSENVSSNEIAALMDELEEASEDDLNLRTGLWTPPG